MALSSTSFSNTASPTPSSMDIITMDTPATSASISPNISAEPSEIDLKSLISKNDLAQPDKEEQAQFNKLSKDRKLERLNVLLQKSQVYSSIIADNILQRSLQKEEPVTVTKKRKVTKKGKGKAKQQDITSMLSTNISQATRSTKEAIESSQSSSSIRQPALVSGGTLKDYQLDGLQWLTTLYENGLNGILADEMGLGKTLQCIAFLSFLIERDITGPFLIVVPLSTLTNWCKEIEKFAPKLQVFKFSGTKSERSRMNLHNLITNKKMNIVITSYETSIREFKKLRAISWKYLIVDEGHRLKNSECILIKFLKQLPTSNRLLITGTPLQNNLNELWSLLNFILPEIFHDLELFQQWFNFDELTNFGADGNAIEEEDDEESAEAKRQIKLNISQNLIKNLHTILKPFILRRLKKDVIKNLPPKKEYLIHIPMTTVQKNLYFDAINNKLYNSLIALNLKEFINYNHSSDFSSEQDFKIIDDFLANPKPLLNEPKRRTRTYKEADSDDEFTFDISESHEKELSYEEILPKLKKMKKIDRQHHILHALHSKITKDVKNLSLQNMMMQLRNICGSPYLYYEPFVVNKDSSLVQHEDKFMKILYKNSAKIQVLQQLCEKLFKHKHKLLIFSQFTRILDLLQDWFGYNGIQAARLDGSVDLETRDNEIFDFNNNAKTKVFLLSTRSGGLGINLTAADTVILFDNDWNPQMDLQAIDRVHRIGQTKPVKIFRFVIKNSIEEILIHKSSSKRFLEKLVIEMGEFKFNRLKKLIGTVEEKNDLNVTELIELSKITFQPSEDEVEEGTSLNYQYGEDDLLQVHNLLTDAEMSELFDRTPECYRKEDEVQYPNISVFETANNLDNQMA